MKSLTVAERLFRRGFEQGLREARQSLIEEAACKAMADLLAVLLAQRFGPLPAPVLDRLRGASRAALDRIVARLITSPTLADALA